MGKKVWHKQGDVYLHPASGFTIVKTTWDDTKGYSIYNAADEAIEYFGDWQFALLADAKKQAMACIRAAKKEGN